MANNGKLAYVVCRACPPYPVSRKRSPHAGPIWKPIALFLNVTKLFWYGVAAQARSISTIATRGASICSTTTKKNPKQLPCLGFLVNKQFGSNRLSDVGGWGARGTAQPIALRKEQTRSALGSCWPHRGHLVARLRRLNFAVLVRDLKNVEICSPKDRTQTNFTTPMRLCVFRSLTAISSLHATMRRQDKGNGARAYRAQGIEP